MSVFLDAPEIVSRTFAENDLVFAFLTNIPITPGHSLIAPKREVQTYAELTQDEILAIHQLIVRTQQILSRTMHAKGFNIAWNEGSEYGQSVPHLHIHIVPRTPNDNGIFQYEPRQFLYRPGSRATTPEHELSEIASLLRSVA